jgi:integrase
MSRNPTKLAGRNPEPPPRSIRTYPLVELDALAAELSKPYQPLPAFAAATGLRPEEWAALERRDIDRRARIVSVRRTVSDGVIVELGKTSKSRRQVPLSRRASAALDALPPRLDTPLLVPAPEGGLLDLDNFRRGEWAVAVEASGVATPARIYDLGSTFASNALAASVTVFELARVMGTSVRIATTEHCSTERTTSSPVASTRSRLSSKRPWESESLASRCSPGAVFANVPEDRRSDQAGTDAACASCC